MDQDSFRQLLQQAPRGASSNGSSSIPKVARAPKASSKAKAPKADEPAFKPRKLKKNELKYRDRAAERRDGGGNDYAEVEAVLEDFEKRTAKEDKDAVDEQRRYLGGDSEHSILVKGLDMALLEQNKARAVASTDDDETLEQAFIQVTSEPTVSKKRTREDIIRELKEKRQIGAGPQAATSVAKAPEDEARVLEEAKKAGKFRPIGFKPIGSQKDAKGKKKRAKEGDKDGERKKKRRKEEHITNNQPSGSGMQDNVPLPKLLSPTAATKSSSPNADPSPPDDDFDIFAGAGEYEGIDVGEDDESDVEAGPSKRNSDVTSKDQHSPITPLPSKRGWFAPDEEESEQPAAPLPDPNDATITRESQPGFAPLADEDEEPEQPIRLQPLESSALPSIRDFLAMDHAAEVQEKRKARKEKKKKKKGGEEDDD